MRCLRYTSRVNLPKGRSLQELIRCWWLGEKLSSFISGIRPPVYSGGKTAGANSAASATAEAVSWSGFEALKQDPGLASSASSLTIASSKSWRPSQGCGMLGTLLSLLPWQQNFPSCPGCLGLALCITHHLVPHFASHLFGSRVRVRRKLPQLKFHHFDGGRG